MAGNKPDGIFYVGGPGQIIGRPGGAVRVAGGIVPLPSRRIDPYPMPPTIKPVLPPERKPVMHPPHPMPVQTAPPITPGHQRRAHAWHGHGHRPSPRRGRPHRQHPAHFGPPVHVPPAEITPPIPPPMPVPVPIATGPICPSWGWMVSTNPDGSETVHRCSPGQPAAPGLHGLESITAPIQAALGPNWMLYAGLALGAWLLLKKR